VGSESQRNRSVGPDSIFILANILTLLNQLIVKTCHFARKTWCLPLTGKDSPTTKPVELNTVPVLEARRIGGGGGVGYRLSGFFFPLLLMGAAKRSIEDRVPLPTSATTYCNGRRMVGGSHRYNFTMHRRMNLAAELGSKPVRRLA